MSVPGALDRRFLFLAVAAAIVVSLLRPRPVHTPATPPVRAVYDHIEGLAPGAHVLINFNYSPGTRAELHPMAVAILHHCYRKGVIPLGMSMVPEGVGMARQAFEETGQHYEKEPGRDFVVLGFKPGAQALIINMGEDFYSAYPKDCYGKLTRDLPALKGLSSLRDMDLVIDLATSPTPEVWVAYGQEKYRFPLAAGCTAVVAPGLYPFLQTKQLLGLIAGMKGAAEYENLVGKPDEATQGMFPQSVVHLLIIAFVLFGNATYFWARRQRRTGEE